jgi:autotransporter-associated beta strand protein
LYPKIIKFKVIFLATIILFILPPSFKAAAENITYTGDPANLKTSDIGGASTGSVFPGLTNSPLASNNKVTIDFSSGTTPYRIFGGLSDSEIVNGNKVIFLNGSVLDNVYGGYSNNSAEKNGVFLYSGLTVKDVYGGYSNNGNSYLNSVFIDGATALNAWGGYGSQEAVNNRVDFISGAAQIIIGGSSSAGDATQNTVSIFASASASKVIGGETLDSGSASNNSADMVGGLVKEIYGGTANKGTADNNNVSVLGGEVYKVVGGISDSSTGAGASGNKVTIGGDAVINGEKFGETASSGFVYGGISNGDTTGNIITINGNPVIGFGVEFIGGFSTSGDSFTGNTLIKNSESSKIPVALNFEYISFGYSGQDNMHVLNTTPMGAEGKSFVKLDTGDNDVIITATITGSGGVEKTGLGSLTLSQLIHYTGDTLVSSGLLVGKISSWKLEVAEGATYDTGSANPSVTELSGAGKIIVNLTLSAEAGNFSGEISGAGSVEKNGSGSLSFSGTNSYLGGTMVSSGTLEGAIGPGKLQVNGGATYSSGSVASSVTELSGAGNIIVDSTLSVKEGSFSGNISGSGALEKNGAGTLTLSGTNGYTGLTTISEGTLKGGVPDGGDLKINSGATYDAGSSPVNIGDLSGAGTLAKVSFSIKLLSGDFSGSITGVNFFGITKDGEGILEFSGPNVFTGQINVNDGVLRLRDENALGPLSGIISSADGITKKPSLELAFPGTFNTSVSGEISLTADPGVSNTLTLGNISADYGGMTVVKSGILNNGGKSLSSSGGLILYGGAEFIDSSSGAYSLAGKELMVNAANGQSAVFRGDLQASGAVISFISPSNPSEPLLIVDGDADVSGSDYRISLSGDSSLAVDSALTLIKVLSPHILTATGFTYVEGLVSIGSTITHELTGAHLQVDEATGLVMASVGDTPPGSPPPPPPPDQGGGEEEDVPTLPPVTPPETLPVEEGLSVEGELGPLMVKEETKALSEGFIGGLTLTVQGSDLISGKGTEAARGSAAAAGSYTPAGFGAFSGGTLRYNTGSHVDLNSFSILAGLAWGIDTNPGEMTLGAFMEYGTGSYDTYNSFPEARETSGGGDTNYLGFGVMFRMDFTGGENSYFYLEGSGRGGRIKNGFTSPDITDAQGKIAEYDASSSYGGFHLGAGYVRKISERLTLDLYGKYFFTRQKGDTVILSTGESILFEDADSSRFRGGGRLSFKASDYLEPYFGAAFEYELSGNAKATVNGFPIEAPSMRGGTGIGEFGVVFLPSKESRLSFDLGVQGYLGKAEGVTGSFVVKVKF